MVWGRRDVNLDISSGGSNEDKGVDSRNIYKVKPGGPGDGLDKRTGKVECV